MRHFFSWLRPLWVDRKTRVIIIISLILNIAAWALMAYRLGPLIMSNTMISLHSSIYIGVNAAGSARLALLVPGLGLIALIMNTIFARFAYTRERLITFVFLFLTLFYELAAAAIVGFIILLNLKM